MNKRIVTIMVGIMALILCLSGCSNSKANNSSTSSQSSEIRVKPLDELGLTKLPEIKDYSNAEYTKQRQISNANIEIIKKKGYAVLECQ
ncbi:MAG: hypothetical protein FWF42_01905 [Streptococcaceae bacterium]|nr:hypothetical protein [Streptococcaceae bacterium]